MGTMKTVFLIVSVFILVLGWSVSYAGKVKYLCEKIDVKACKRVGYLYTMLPNRFGHTDQNQVERHLKPWSKVLWKGCSSLLRDFLCRIYLPPCIYDQPQLPCRSMCNDVRNRCRRVMKKLNVKWPPSLKCSKLSRHRCYLGRSSLVSPKLVQSVKIVKLKQNKGFSRTKAGDCQQIAISICKSIGYNFTRFPNMFGHRRQLEAAFELQELVPALKVGCSSSLNLFLCSMYAPMCTHYGIIPPCRSLCERSKEGCEPLFNKFGFIWPAKFNCSTFPEGNSGGDTCISKPPDNQTEMSNVTTTKPPPSTQLKRRITKTFPQPEKSHGRICQNLTIPMCRRLDYNFTYFPNFFKHRTQDEAAVELIHFAPLVKIQCSRSLEWFLCSLYAPICTDVELLPCRSLCRRSRRGCLPVLNSFGYQWPEQFDCSQFPEEGNGQVCIP